MRPRGDLGEAGARRAGEAARRPGLLEATLLLSPSTEELVMMSSPHYDQYYPGYAQVMLASRCTVRGMTPWPRCQAPSPESPARITPYTLRSPRLPSRARVRSMAVRMEYISRIICPESPGVTPAEQSGLQVYTPAQPASHKLMFTGEKCHLLDCQKYG